MRTFFTAILLFTATILFSQTTDQIFTEKGEIYFRFYVLNKADINSFTKIISIDKVEEHAVYAYANQTEFNEFLQRRIAYEVLTHPGDMIKPEMSDNIEDILNWNVYPTYDGYVNMMNQFALNYPDICTIIDAGTTIQGRKILFAKISDNVSTREPEPQFMYSSTMHGDETTGYVLMLRLIDSLLTSYGTDPRITNMINNMEIWINPLANPDGTYRSGNSTVSGAIRGNAALVDLNRNFPDPQSGPNSNQQPETTIMVNLAEANNFVLLANFHGGAEVVNYPWDRWQRLHPDNNWYMFISHLYADTCQENSPSGYMTSFNDGITNGYAWYSISGGRQDYFNYYRHAREVTIEISNTKMPSASLLPNYWSYNRKSFLTYMENCLYGVKGIVTDTSGNPVKAFISINGHDADSSQIYSHPVTGDYYRMLAPGDYIFNFSAPGFFTYSTGIIDVTNFNATVLNIELVPDGTPVELISFTAATEGNSVILNWSTASELNNKGFNIERKSETQNWTVVSFITGNGTSTETHLYNFTDENLPAGKYSYRLKQIDFDGSYAYSRETHVELNDMNFTLFQNYPNPFNPITTFRFTLPKDENVSLVIFDALGKEIATLVNHTHKTGEYKYEWDASEYGSGMYFYRLQAGEYSAVKKMILLK